jgi:inner membrane transporter RhtA
VFHYLGPSFAVLVFARVPILGVAWLRITSAALIFAVWRRPWRLRTRLARGTRGAILTWGCVLAAMNCCFYEAIARLPLATVAAIEFLPVIALAALGVRTPRNTAALASAVVGVYLLTGVQIENAPMALAFAFANAALFAAYIVLAHRVAADGALAGIDGLAAAMVVASAVVTPIGGWGAASAIGDPIALAAGVGVGVCSSVIPYVASPSSSRPSPSGPGRWSARCSSTGRNATCCRWPSWPACWWRSAPAPLPAQWLTSITPPARPASSSSIARASRC